MLLSNIDEDFGVIKGLPKAIVDEFADVKKALLSPLDKAKEEVNQELHSLIDRIPSEVLDNFRDERRKSRIFRV